MKRIAMLLSIIMLALLTSSCTNDPVREKLSERILQPPGGTLEATCIGDDKSLCVCSGKCEAGETCKCIKPNPFDDLPPPPSDNPDGNSSTLVDQVIGRYGIAGEWCFSDANTKHCISKTDGSQSTSQPKPIAMGEPINAREPLYICTETLGALHNCVTYEPTLHSIECNFPPGGSSGSCFCNDESSCSTMAAACPSGSCGDCNQGQCCGTGCQQPIDPQ